MGHTETIGQDHRQRMARPVDSVNTCDSWRNIPITVRREKALDFSGCKSRPGTGSLHPVAIETAAEATKLSELSV